MFSLLLLGITSFIFSLIFTPIVRRLAVRFGAVDSPNVRKTHTNPVPRLGGVSIFAAALCSFGVLFLVKFRGVFIVQSTIPLALRLLPATIVIFAVGLADDIFNLKPWYKLGAQVAAAILAWSAGIRLLSLGGHPFTLYGSLILTVLWIVACSNAVNLIDGVDGLATGAGLFATVTMIIAGLLHGNMDLVFAITPVAAALLGFLRFNFNPASIFLGDCGSLTLGFVLGCFGIVWSEKAPTLLAMTAPLLTLSVPLLDTSISVLRRFLRHQPIFGADRAHIHHKLLSRGLAPRRVVLLLYAFCGVSAGTSILLTSLHPQYQSLVIILVCVVAAIALQFLDYTEFRVASKAVLEGSIRRLVAAEIDLDTFEKELTAAKNLEDCWHMIKRNYERFGFSRIILSAIGVREDGSGTGGWHVQVDLPNHGYVRLYRSEFDKRLGAAALLFVDCLSRVLSPKIEEIIHAPILNSDPDQLESVPAVQVTYMME